MPAGAGLAGASRGGTGLAGAGWGGAGLAGAGGPGSPADSGGRWTGAQCGLGGRRCVQQLETPETRATSPALPATPQVGHSRPQLLGANYYKLLQIIWF